MSPYHDVSESIELLMSFLKVNEGNEMYFLLAGGFVKGTLDHAPENQHAPFILVSATRYSLNGDREEVDHLSIRVSEIYGWGGDSPDFLDRNYRPGPGAAL